MPFLSSGKPDPVFDAGSFVIMSIWFYHQEGLQTIPIPFIFRYILMPGSDASLKPLLTHGRKKTGFIKETGSDLNAPEKARTPNLSVRSRTLYPIELLVHGLQTQEILYHINGICQINFK